MKITKYIVNSIDRLPKGYVFTDEDFMGEVKRMKQSLQHSTEWLLPAKEIVTSEVSRE